MATTTSRRKKLLKAVTVNLGCGCAGPKLSAVFSPKPKSAYHRTHYNHHYYHPPPSSGTTASDHDYYQYQTTPSTYTNSTVTNTSTTTSSSSPFMAADQLAGGWTVAVEKDSADPYSDFKASMLQMIQENGLYTKHDLKNLLACFLQLNSPCLHGVIIKAFTEIWNSFFYSDPAAPSRSCHNGRRGRRNGGNGRPPKAYVKAKSYEI